MFCIASSRESSPLREPSFFRHDGRIIEWVSGESTGRKSFTDSFVIRSDIGNWHTEPKIVDEINRRFVQNSGELTDKFLSLVQKLPRASGTRYSFGFDIQSSFDMCDECKNTVVEFFNFHKSGQRSILQAINSKLSDKHIEVKKTDFLVTFQSRYPYKDANYSLLFEKNIHNLKYSYPLRPIRKDIFELIDCNSMDEISAYKIPYLTQHISSPIRSGVFSYIHQLGNNEIDYNKETHRFVF